MKKKEVAATACLAQAADASRKNAVQCLFVSQLDLHTQQIIHQVSLKYRERKRHAAKSHHERDLASRASLLCA